MAERRRVMLAATVAAALALAAGCGPSPDAVPTDVLYENRYGGIYVSAVEARPSDVHAAVISVAAAFALQTVTDHTTDNGGSLETQTSSGQWVKIEIRPLGPDRTEIRVLRGPAVPPALAESLLNKIMSASVAQ